MSYVWNSFKFFLKDHILAKPIDDDLFFSLNIWEKFINYRRVPIKLLINLIVCGMLTYYALGYQLYVSDYAVKSRYAVAITLIEPEDETDEAFDRQIANIGEFEEFIEAFVNGYYELPMSSLGVFMHFTAEKDERSPLPVELIVKYSVDKTYEEFQTRSFQLTNDDPLGPFENASVVFPQTETCLPERDANGNAIVPCRNSTLADFFDVLQSVELRAVIRGVECNPVLGIASVLKWTVSTKFGFSAHNSILRAKTSIDFEETQRLRPSPIVISLLLIVISLWGLVLRLYFFLRHFDYASRALSPALLRRYRETVSWHYFGIAAGIMTIIFCIVTLTSGFFNFVGYRLVQWRAITLAFAVFFEYVLLLSHFQNVPRMYIIAQSITTALPHLATYFISIFPIFFGFALASSSALGGVSEIFQSLPHSMITLFCMICGDSLIDIFTMSNTTTFSWLQGFNSALLAIFLFVFIANVLNMALALVQDSFAWVTETHDVEERIHKRIQRSQRVKLGNEAILNPSQVRKDAMAAIKGKRSLSAAIAAIKLERDLLDETAVVYDGIRGMAKRNGSRPAVDPFNDDELDALFRRFTVRKTEVDSESDSSSSDDEERRRVEYRAELVDREELHFHRRRFHEEFKQIDDEERRRRIDEAIENGQGFAEYLDDDDNSLPPSGLSDLSGDYGGNSGRRKSGNNDNDNDMGSPLIGDDSVGYSPPKIGKN